MHKDLCNEPDVQRSQQFSELWMSYDTCSKAKTSDDEKFTREFCASIMAPSHCKYPCEWVSSEHARQGCKLLVEFAQTNTPFAELLNAAESTKAHQLTTVACLIALLIPSIAT